MPVGLDSLGLDAIREALRLLVGEEPPSQRTAALRALRDALRGYGTVRSALDRAPEGARAAFVRLVDEGPVAVSDLLGRGWWGHGSLPPPLDWLQRRALVGLDADGLVDAVEDARAGFTELTLEVAAPPPDSDAAGVLVEPAASVVVAADAVTLDRAVAVPAAGLRAVAPTVAVSARQPAAVAAALRRAGVRLDDDTAVAAAVDRPLPGTAEDAVGPRAIRELLQRAVDEQRQVRLRYFASSRGGAATERVVDPWSFQDDLLRGWCHLRTDERTFAVDRIGHARLLATAVEHRPGRA